MQVLGGTLHKDYIHNNPEIKNKDKYKLTGIPRMDLDIIPEFINVETTELKNKYNIPNNKKIYLLYSPPDIKDLRYGLEVQLAKPVILNGNLDFIK